MNGKYETDLLSIHIKKKKNVMSLNDPEILWYVLKKTQENPNKPNQTIY